MARLIENFLQLIVLPPGRHVMIGEICPLSGDEKPVPN